MKRIIHQLCFILVLIFICTSAQGNYPSDQSGGVSVPPDGLLSDPGRAVLSMDIKDEPLKEVLERISDQNGITFILPPSLAEEKVMMRFSNLTLEEGLSKILSPYNHIFIYRESQRPSKFPVAQLEKVRIFPHTYEGRVQEPLMSIAEGTSDSKGAVPSEGKEKDRAASNDEGSRGETYIETLTTTLQGRDREAKLDAVKVLRDAGTVDAVRALSFAIRDKNPTVQKEAVSALKALGEEIIVKEGPAERTEDTSDDDTNNRRSRNNSDDDEEANNDEAEEPTQEGTAYLTLGSITGDGRNFDINNNVPVSSVQFIVKGGQPSDVRTTARTEGFFAKLDEKSGNVLLFHPSRETIAPGSGPIVEIVATNGGSVQLTPVLIADENGHAIK